VLAVTGVVIGHTITYAVAFPDDHHRAALLRDTGHAYWQAAVAVALLAGAVAACSHMAHAVRHAEPLSLPRAGLRLAGLQMVVFTMMETSERVAVDQPLTSLFDHRVLLLGLVVQVAVAAVLVQVLRLLGRAAVAVAGAVATRWSPAAPPVVSLSWTAPQPVRDAVVGRPCGSRAPPLAA
jgi:hypothetical protein